MGGWWIGVIGERGVVEVRGRGGEGGGRQGDDGSFF